MHNACGSIRSDISNWSWRAEAGGMHVCIEGAAADRRTLMSSSTLPALMQVQARPRS